LHDGTQLLDRGAAKVYAAVRNPEAVSDPRLTSLRLDLADRSSLEAATQTAGDLVINNAGVSTGTATLGREDGRREELEINYLGPVAVCRAFAPILAANGGGALVNMLSALSWFTLPRSGACSSAKAALWAATNSSRQYLQARGTLVTAVSAGYVDTEMTAAVVGVEKTAPQAVVAAALDAVEASEYEVLVDEVVEASSVGSVWPAH
jgi:NAD(P)-dependent dehydrogenase (short-subunit alcohol dehydrogenase family)